MGEEGEDLVARRHGGLARFVDEMSGHHAMRTRHVACEDAMGFDLTESNFPILTESYLVMWELVKHGLGIGILDGTIGDAEPRVRRVLPDLAPLMFPVWLVAHREVSTSRRVRAVFDLLAAELAAP